MTTIPHTFELCYIVSEATKIATMQIPDLVTMLINAGQSLVPVMELFAGIAYAAGFVFILVAFGHLRKIADRRALYPSHEKGFIPLMYFLIGAALLFLPDTIKIISNTLFNENILSYGKIQNPQTLYNAVSLLFKVIGIIWVLRGCVLIVSATHPGVQEGSKGISFLAAGILALNLESTIKGLNTILQKIITAFP